jgi:hypothetical protein
MLSGGDQIRAGERVVCQNEAFVTVGIDEVITRGEGRK